MKEEDDINNDKDLTLVYEQLTRSLVQKRGTFPKNLKEESQWFLLAISCYKLRKYDESLFALSNIQIVEPPPSKSQVQPLRSLISRGTRPDHDLNDSGSAYMIYLQAKC
jgi:hypothetical protein